MARGSDGASAPKPDPRTPEEDAKQRATKDPADEAAADDVSWETRNGDLNG